VATQKNKGLSNIAIASQMLYMPITSHCVSSPDMVTLPFLDEQTSPHTK